MKGLFGLRRYCTLATALLVCLGGLARLAAAQDIYLNKMNVDRILYFGNSITIHAPEPDINWYGNWGMAASDAAHDYVHLLTGDIAQAAHATPATMATMNADWEWNYMSPTYDWTTLQPQLDFKPTVVVVAIGENVVPLTTQASKTTFATAFTRLIDTFKADGNPAIFVRSSFIADPTAGVMQQVANAEHVTYIDQTWVTNDPANHAYSEPYYANDWHFNGHPGNQGMSVIATSLYNSMVAYSLTAPEPGTLTLLAVGCVGFLVRRARR